MIEPVQTFSSSRTLKSPIMADILVPRIGTTDEEMPPVGLSTAGRRQLNVVAIDTTQAVAVGLGLHQLHGQRHDQPEQRVGRKQREYVCRNPHRFVCASKLTDGASRRTGVILLIPPVSITTGNHSITSGGPNCRHRLVLYKKMEFAAIFRTLAIDFF